MILLEHADTSSKMCNVAICSKKKKKKHFFITIAIKTGEEEVPYKFIVDPFLYRPYLYCCFWYSEESDLGRLSSKCN